MMGKPTETADLSSWTLDRQLRKLHWTELGPLNVGDSSVGWVVQGSLAMGPGLISGA